MAEDPTQAGPYARTAGEPPYRPLRIYTRDPAHSKREQSITVLEVPYEPLDRGPCEPATRRRGKRGANAEDNAESCVLHGGLFAVWLPTDLVREYLAEHGNRVCDDARLNETNVAMSQGHAPSTSSPWFKAQMVYAVASVTYQRFRRALGRDPHWNLPARQTLLKLRPAASSDSANAYYDAARGEISFGSFKALRGARGALQEGARVHTALSHDVIVHEVVHALLDGMKPNLMIPTNPDVLAFHEGFADLVALFLHFTHRTVVEAALVDTRGDDLAGPMLVELARQFGQAVDPDGGGALRTGITNADDPETLVAAAQQHNPDLDPHTLGSVLVSAVFEAFRTIYRAKTTRLRRAVGAGPVSENLAKLLANAASDLADQFLDLLIRAIDYLPPVDPTFGDYLRAIVTADRDMIADDNWGYREALIYAFRRYGITVYGVEDLSEEELIWRPFKREFETYANRHRTSAERLVDDWHAVFAATDATQGFGSGTSPRPAVAAVERLILNLVGEGSARWRRPFNRSQRKQLREFAEQVFGFEVSEDDADGYDLPFHIGTPRTLRRTGLDGLVVNDLLIEITAQSRLEVAGRGYGWPQGATLIVSRNGHVRYLIGKGAGNLQRGDTSRKARFEEFIARADERQRDALAATASLDDDLRTLRTRGARMLKAIHAKAGHMGYVDDRDAPKTR